MVVIYFLVDCSWQITIIPKPELRIFWGNTPTKSPKKG